MPTPNPPRRRRFAFLAGTVLVLTVFNLGFWLTNEAVAEWDESLYALSAIEMIDSGHWLAPTLDGEIDYYNSKPPLNIWILALLFKYVGPSLFTLRVTSTLAACATVLVVMMWGRSLGGDAVGLTAGVVLATTFGFLHVHSGRSGNPDALLTLLLSLVVVVLADASRRPGRWPWLGPLFAGVFMLKGMAVLMPLALVVVTLLLSARQPGPSKWIPVAQAMGLFALLVAPWIVARFEFDGWSFLRLLVTQDLLTAATVPLEGHNSSVLYYANVLQRYQYDWLLAGAAVGLLCSASSRRLGADVIRQVRDRDPRTLTVLSWAILALVVPTAMQTKLPWYLNPFYPMFALGVGGLIARGLSGTDRHHWRRRLALGIVVAIAVAAEAKLLWHPVHRRGREGTTQELLLAVAGDLRGRTVFRHSWTAADLFVLRGLVAARPGQAESVDAFIDLSGSGDPLIAQPGLVDDRLAPLMTNGRETVYVRR